MGTRSFFVHYIPMPLKFITLTLFQIGRTARNELDDFISENFTRDKWLDEVLNYSIIARHVSGVYKNNPIKFLTQLQEMLLYKSDFCMHDAECILIRHRRLPKSIVAKDISTIPNLLIQNDLFEWLDYISESGVYSNALNAFVRTMLKRSDLFNKGPVAQSPYYRKLRHFRNNS